MDTMSNQQKTEIEVLQKLRSYCTYQERAEFEVRQKAGELGLNKDSAEKMIEILKQEKFVNDQRFAEVFAGSKFRQKQWGRHKIRAALYERRVNSAAIDLALTEIDPIEYEKTLETLIDRAIDEKRSAEQIFQSMKRKGFEGELIYSILHKKKLV